MKTQTPQEAFEEAANLAKGFFGARPDDDPEPTAKFAVAFGYEYLHTGGGCMVAVRKVDDTHVIGVTDELTALYEVDLGPGCSAEDMFFASAEEIIYSENF